MIKRKKRWHKKLNKKYCQHCLSFGCDFMASPDTIANRKRRKRREMKLCEACGKKDCICRNKGHNKNAYTNY